METQLSIGGRTRLPRITKSVCSGLVLATMIGCSPGDAGPETYPVTGTVTIEGQPLSGAVVTFYASANGIDAIAMTNESGAFDVSTYFDLGKREQHGMAPGDYRVTITKFGTASIKATGAPPKNLLPKKYAKEATSGLQRTVSKGDNHFEFELE